MNERIIQLRRVAKAVLFILLLSIAGLTKAQTENITFADANVKAICVANWDTDGDGELNQAEAAAVTSLDGVFMFDDGITSFDELQFFIGLASIGEDEFNSCTSLASITIPNAVTSIGNYAFSDCSSLTSMTSYACTPPALGNDVFYNVPSIVVLNVPCHTSAMYQEADGWSDFSNYGEFEYGLCPIPFADATVKAICIAHWDTNEDGELSYAEAAAVTNLGTYFKSTAITSFDELEYFTSLTSLPNTAFYGCTSLTSIALPASVSALGNGSFYNCTSLSTMTVYAETPPTVGTNAFKNVPIDMVVYVPCGTYEVYHTASGWSEFTIVQQSGLCPIVFADANVKALCVANWDTDGDGELSYDEAAAVTDIGSVFRNNSNITSFDELQYFTGLVSIGHDAFAHCSNLATVIIPNSVISIESSAFGWCSVLTLIEIPNSVNSIGTLAFGNCSALEQIIVESGNIVFDSRENCNAVIETASNTLVFGCKNSIIPNSVTSIGECAFRCESLTSIVIPNSVTSIGYYAFGYCSGLTSITIPNSVTSIGNFAFSSCSGLEMIIVDSGNAIYDSRENCNGIIRTSTNSLVTGCKNTVIPNSVTSIGFAAFDGCNGLTTIEIPNSVASIGQSAFRYCNGLTTIAIPNSVISIGNYAFQYCSGLVSITIPNSVTSIGDGVFNGCSGLSSIEIPNSVFSIGNYAFQGCSALTSMTVLAYTPPILDNYAFSYVDKSIPVYVPIGTVSAYQSSSGWNEFTNIQEIGPNPITFADANVKALCVANWDTNSDGELSFDEAAAVTDLGEVFRNTSINSFNELQYFYNLTSIGDNAFYWCSGLNSIEFPNSVTSIGNSAFYYCRNLTAIEIPSSVTYIGSRAFFHCTSITAIEIPSSVLSIAYSAFNGCSGLAQIIVDSGNMVYDSRENCNAIIKTSNNELVTGCKNTEIPNSVTSIGDEAFIYCTGLTAIEIPSSVTSIGYFAFGNCTAITTIEIQGAVNSIGNYVFCNCTSLSAIEIPSSVTYIGSHAFSNCSSLTAIGIPSSVISIGDDAFAGCSGLTAIEIPSSVTNMGRNPFMSCINLDQIVVDSWNTVYDSRGNCNAIIKTSNNKLVIGCKNTEIPNSVTSVGDYAFCGCSSLISVEIPSSVTSIGYYAFSSCTGLASVEIPSSVTSIEGEAFRYCTSLTSMTVLSNNPPALGAQVFYNINSEIPVYVPCVALFAYHNSPGWDMFTNYLPVTACNSGEIIVTTNPAEGGTVMGEGSYEGGVTCTLIAIANHGYSFIYWTEDNEVVSSDAEYTFTVAGDRNLIANFIAMPPMPVVAEYYPDSNEPNSPYVKVHWAAGPYEVMIGDSTSTINTAYMPFYTLYDNSISEALYTAAELIEAGATAGSITSLSWEAVSVTTNQPQYNISIWMANVPDTELTTTSHLANNMTLVYTGNIGIPPLGWNEFVFNESNFVWDGTSNILILCQRNNGQWNGRVSWRSHNPGFYGMAYKYQDGTPYDVTSQIYTLYLSNTVRPNIIMKGEGAMTYNLYRANCDGTDAQLIAENLDDTQYIDETWWQLENDSYKYGVSIADSTNTDIFWSNCIENNFIPTAFHFITPGNWSNAANWQYGALPGVYDIVFIDADCQLDMTTEVAELTVSNGQSLTLQPNKTLTVTGDLTNTSTTGLVIKAGAQLINATGNVAATMEKDIVAYGNDNPDAWYTIASPMDEMPIEGSSFVTPEFDLYRFNENNLTNEEWENYKGGLADFTTFENGRGYLFANSNAFSPAFTGTLNASSVTYPLSYTERPDDPLSGFHLIGNPFPHDIYKGEGAAIDDANLASGYYTLTNEGTWQVHTYEDAIHPGQGILVKATAPTILTIAKSTAVATSETGGAKRETRPISISVKGENGQDQAFVYFGRGNSMEKMGGFATQEPSLWISDNGKDYAIAHVDKGNESLEVCFSSKQEGDFTLTVDRNDTDFEYLQLVDHVTGLTVDLLKQPTYGFHATGQEPDARFSIRFKVAK